MNIPINDFAGISLREMESIRLMNRIDTKYVAPASLLPQLLGAMKPLFKIQVADNSRMAHYATQYFDTPSLEFYLMHQNGKMNRQKIRIRTYLDSKCSFLEIKDKDNRGRTNKRRIPTSFRCISPIEISGAEKDFLERYSHVDVNRLIPVLANHFLRMTFVNNYATERITIDTGLTFSDPSENKEYRLDNLMILELKQNSWQRSDFRDILRNLRLHPCSFSKYCIGTLLTNPGVKHNRFKSKMHIINKHILCSR